MIPELQPQVDRVNVISTSAKDAFEFHFRSRLDAHRRLSPPEIVAPAPVGAPVPEPSVPMEPGQTSPQEPNLPLGPVTHGDSDKGVAVESQTTRLLRFIKDRLLFWR